MKMENLNIEESVRIHLISKNHAAIKFCGTTDKRSLSQALNSRFGGAVVSFLTDSTRSLSGNGLESHYGG